MPIPNSTVALFDLEHEYTISGLFPKLLIRIARRKPERWSPGLGHSGARHRGARCRGARLMAGAPRFGRPHRGIAGLFELVAGPAAYPMSAGLGPMGAGV